jgi:hypothetical protein
MSEKSAEDPGRPERARAGELITVVVLAISAVLTAWSGFEASKWGGAMSIAFSRASSARIEASRHEAEADAARIVDLQIFAVYVEAVATDDAELREFVEERFTDHFVVAFDAWIEMRPLENPDAPRAPFALPEYRPPGEAEAVEADARADALYQEALQNNQRGDDYTLLTVLFALVMFFAAVSQRLRSATLSRVVLATSVVMLLVGVGFLLSFPKII